MRFCGPLTLGVYAVADPINKLFWEEISWIIEVGAVSRSTPMAVMEVAISGYVNISSFSSRSTKQYSTKTCRAPLNKNWRALAIT